MITTLKKLFSLKNCPICERELTASIDDYYECPNNCYRIYIDNKKFETYSNGHIYFFPAKYKPHDKIEYLRDGETHKFLILQKRINYWKENNRYLFEILA